MAGGRCKRQAHRDGTQPAKKWKGCSGVTMPVLENTSLKCTHHPGAKQFAARMGLIPGLSFDLTTVDPGDGQPWVFNNPAKAVKAEQMVRDKRFLLLIRSPMCTMLSVLQKMNWAKIGEKAMTEMLDYETRHLEWCAKLYNIQRDNGLYFLHEHPVGASSWQNELIKELGSKEGVYKVHGDMRCFGMTQEDAEGIGAIKKRTGFLTNSQEIAKVLQETVKASIGTSLY